MKSLACVRVWALMLFRVRVCVCVVLSCCMILWHIWVQVLWFAFSSFYFVRRMGGDGYVVGCARYFVFSCPLFIQEILDLFISLI